MFTMLVLYILNYLDNKLLNKSPQGTNIVVTMLKLTVGHTPLNVF